MRHLGRRPGARACAAMLLALSLVGPSRVQAAGCEVRARPPALESLWQKLDRVRLWREGFAERTGDLTVPHTKSYRQMLEDYSDLPRPGSVDPPRVLPTDLSALAGDAGFRAYTSDPGAGCQAGNGLQEALGEIMVGQLLAGNDRLLRGLRVRYPKTGDDADPRYDNDPTRMLRESVAIFQLGVEPAMRRLGEAPDGLRAGSRVNPDFPVWVENTPKPPSATGEVVENELYQLTQLVLRRGIAETAYGRRAFFLGNDDSAKREEAASIVKRAGHSTYLDSAVLAAVQSPHDFQQNFGTELRGVISESQDLFDDIHKGVNPLRQRGDFIPDATLQNLISNARTTWASALDSETAVKTHRRQYDEDYSALEDELENQQGDGRDHGGSLKKVYDEIGLTIPVANPVWTLCDALDLAKVGTDDPRRAGCAAQVYDLRTEEGQTATLLLGWDQRSGNDPDGFVEEFLGCDADICVAHQEWVQAGIEVDLAQKNLDLVKSQIAIEDERAGRIHTIVQRTGERQRGYDIAQAGVAAIPDLGVTVGSEGVSVSATISGSNIASKAIQVDQNWLDVLKEGDIGDAEHVATVKNLQLQGATLRIEWQQAVQAQTVARNRYTALIGDLQWILAGFARAQKKLAKQYFTNPAYRMQLDEAELNADLAFESAMIDSYLLAKRLEYEWSERLINPVQLVNGDDKPIGGSAKYNPVTTAESAFSVSSVGGGDSPELSLRTYLEALQHWDTDLRNDPGRATGETSTKTFSLKEQLLGIVGDAEYERLAFRRFVATHRVPGLNAAQQDLVIEFGVPIDDEELFPFVPNLRIESLEADLRSVPGRSIVGPEGLRNPPQVEMLIGGQATLRSFAATERDDRTLTLDLLSPDEDALQQSQFYTIVDAKVDGVGGPFRSTGLRGRSPSATRWLLRIKMSNGANRVLRLDNLDDILITFTTHWGEPADFPEIFPVQ